jgi:hypothetical protein
MPQTISPLTPDPHPLVRPGAADRNLDPVTVRQKIDRLVAEPPVGDLGYAADQRLVASALLGLQLLADEIDALKTEGTESLRPRQSAEPVARRVVADTTDADAVATVADDTDAADADAADDTKDTDLADIVAQLAELTAQLKKLTKAVKRSTGKQEKKPKK